MQIDFYKGFYKKENSTLRPTVSGAVTKETVTGHLKEPCSILHPVVRFQSPIKQNDTHDFYRYAYIPLFGRYYWIDDWTWEDGLWTVTMDVDVLATYKDDIGSQTEYILRTDSDTNNFDGAITDTMYPATTDFGITKLAFRNPFINSDFFSEGTYVVGVISGDNTNAVGAITYWAMTSTEFGALRDTLFGQDGLEAMSMWDAIQHTWTLAEMSEEMFKTMYNPYQYIASCTWFPVQKSDISGNQQNKIKIGWWEFNLNGKRMNKFTGSFYDERLQIPPHPQAATRGKYLNYAPYTSMTLHGRYGSIPLNTEFLEVGSYLINDYTVDYITGQCLFEVYVASTSAGVDRVLITKTEFLIGVPIQLAQIGRDYLGMTVNAIEAGKQATTGALLGGAVAGVGGMIIGAIASGGSAIYDTINSAMPQMRTSGTNGSFIGNSLSTVLVIIHHKIVDENITHKGRPLCQLRTINTLSGFVMCADGEIDLDCYDAERRKISQFLMSGFFWE